MSGPGVLDRREAREWAGMVATVGQGTVVKGEVIAEATDFIRHNVKPNQPRCENPMHARPRPGFSLTKTLNHVAARRIR